MERNFKSCGVRSYEVTSDSIIDNFINVIASSETPYKRYDTDLGEYWEILGHKANEVNLKRLKNKSAFLYEHDHSRQIAVNEEVYLDEKNRQIISKVKFSNNPFPQEVLRDIKEGIRNKISIGYIIHRAIIVGYDENGIAIVRAIDWEPMEISSVSTPADDSIYVIRSLSQEDQKRTITIVDNNEVAPIIEENKEEVKEEVKPLETTDNNDNIEDDGGEWIELTEENHDELFKELITSLNLKSDNNKVYVLRTVKDEFLNKVEEIRKNLLKTLATENTNHDNINTKDFIEVIDNETRNTENKEKGKNKMNVQDLIKKAETFGIKDEVVTQFLRTGKTEEEFDNFVKEQNTQKTKGTRNMDALGLGINDSEIKNYNLFRGIRNLVSGGDCAELEISREIAKRTKQNEEGSGLILPLSFIKASAMKNAVKARAYNSAPGDASGVENLVAEILDASNFVDILRPQLKSAQLGVRTVSGLVGDYAIPVKVSGSSSTWVGDSGASTETSAVFSKRVSKPQMLVSETQLFELAMKQTTPDAQYLAMDDMTRERAVALDRAVFWGTGTNNQPAGIANTSGVSVVSLGANGGAITRDALVDLMKALGSIDANVDNAKYVSNFNVKAALMKLKVDAGSGRFVWDEFKELFAITNNIPSNLTKGTGTNLNGLIFGDFADACITEWGSPELIVDHLTLAKYGKVNIYMRQATDVLVRRPQSFAVIKDIIV